MAQRTPKQWARGDRWRSPVAVVERSGDQKIGPISATHTSQYSCPTACPFLGSGCYAESAGRQPLTTLRLNSAQVTQPIAIARAEAAAVAGLTGRRQLRGHVVGDCRTAAAARIVGASYVAHSAKYGMRHWTYTHAHATVPLRAWSGAHVVASIHTALDATRARRHGYQVLALAVDDRHPTHTPYTDTRTGLRVLPCPAQFAPAAGSRAVTCDRCHMCQDPKVTAKAGCDAVGFQPDHLRKVQRVEHG